MAYQSRGRSGKHPRGRGGENTWGPGKTRGRRPGRWRTVDEMRWRRSVMPTWISLVHVRHGWRGYSTVVGMPRREIEGMHSNAGRKRTGRRTSESWRVEENKISRFLHAKNE